MFTCHLSVTVFTERVEGMTNGDLSQTCSTSSGVRNYELGFPDHFDPSTINPSEKQTGDPTSAQTGESIKLSPKNTHCELWVCFIGIIGYTPRPYLQSFVRSFHQHLNYPPKLDVCMYRGCPSWSAHGIGRLTGPGGGAHQKWVQCPNHADTIGPASYTLAHTCTLCVLSVANFDPGS